MLVSYTFWAVLFLTLIQIALARTAVATVFWSTKGKKQQQKTIHVAPALNC